MCISIDSPCECEHNNPDSLDARLFPSVVSAVAPAVTMDGASSLLNGRGRVNPICLSIYLYDLCIYVYIVRGVAIWRTTLRASTLGITLTLTPSMYLYDICLYIYTYV